MNCYFQTSRNYFRRSYRYDGIGFTK